MSRLKIQPQEKNTAMQLEELRTSENGRIIISTLREKKCAFLVCDGRLKSVTVIGSSGINPGDIVIALVKDVKKDIGACFIEYSEGCDGYLPLDKIPTDVTVCFHIRNMETAGEHIHQHNHVFNFVLCEF